MLRRRLLALLVAAAACRASDPAPPVAPPAPPAPPVSTFVTGVPFGWVGNASSAYTFGVDSGVRHAGPRSVSIRATGTTTGSTAAVLVQQIRADAYRGKRIRYTAFVRTDGAGTSLTAGGALWLRVDGPNATLVLDNMSDRPLHGTSDWTAMSAVVDVAPTAIGLAFGVLLVGPGQMWVDELKIEVVGTDVRATAGPYTGPAFDAATAASVQNTYTRSPSAPVNLRFDGGASLVDAGAVAWLTRAAVPLAGSSPAESPAELEPLRGMVGAARLVALGEGTHGTREFFQMKHRVLQYLVKELGFTAFAIEATWPESNAVNAYVSGGPGDPAVLLSNLYFWTWNTQEVLDMIRWMRAYNATVAPERRVRFSGFDMQYPGAAIDSVFTYVGRVDPPQAPAVDSAYDCLASYRNRGAQQATRVYAADVTGAARARCAAAVARPYALLAAGRERYEAATSADAFARALQSARLVVQWEDMAAQTSAAAGSLARDRYMAENVGWLLDQLPAGSRMMLWAHNGHVMRAPTAMGGRLAARYGADYVAAGFAFGTGSFNARPALADGSLGAVARQSVSDVVPGTLESYAAATGVPRFLVDMRAVATTPAASPLAGPIPMRSIGAGYSASAASAYYAPTLFPADYDLLIYFDTATASTLLPFRFF